MDRKNRRRTADRKRAMPRDIEPKTTGAAKGGALKALGGPDTSPAEQRGHIEVVSYSLGSAQHS